MGFHIYFYYFDITFRFVLHSLSFFFCLKFFIFFLPSLLVFPSFLLRSLSRNKVLLTFSATRPLAAKYHFDLDPLTFTNCHILIVFFALSGSPVISVGSGLSELLSRHITATVNVKHFFLLCIDAYRNHKGINSPIDPTSPGH